MNMQVFECLRAAVNLASEHQVKTLKVLRWRLDGAGYDAETIEEALNLWTDYEIRKKHREANSSED